MHKFELDKKEYAEKKIEIILSVEEGEIVIPCSDVGVGMGFFYTGEKYIPTQHLALGLIVD